MHADKSKQIAQDLDLQSKGKKTSLPSYRFYGNRKKRSAFWEKIQGGMLKLIVLWFLFWFLSIGLLAALTFLLYGSLMIVTIIYIILGIILTMVLTRTLRKRRKFLRKLKKLCKANRYRLQFKRKFLQSFRWTGKDTDFVLDTGKHVYDVSFLTIKKYRSTLYFESKDEIKQVIKPLNNKFTIIFEPPVREKRFPTQFSPVYALDSKIKHKVVLLNPVCQEMYCKDRDGNMAATGSGAEVFGYTVYTGTGFLETVKRNEGY